MCVSVGEAEREGKSGPGLPMSSKTIFLFASIVTPTTTSYFYYYKGIHHEVYGNKE